MKATLTSLVLALALALPVPSMAITITNSTSPNIFARGTELANAIFGSFGSSVMIERAWVSTDSASTASAGLFTGAATDGLGFDSGIVLTTGNTACITNSPCTDDDLHYFSELVVEFTTKTVTDLYFNYVFASEEYKDHAFGSPSYNYWLASPFKDYFTLRLDSFGKKEDADMTLNIAQLPDGSEIGVRNVHKFLNAPYFRNNAALGDVNLPYSGLTTVLTASIQDLTPGYHQLAFKIQDVGDPSRDSSVFIQAGVFHGNSAATVPEPTTLALLGLGFAGLHAARRRKV